MNQNGDKPSHGGDRLYMAKHTDVPEKDILDFGRPSALTHGRHYAGHQ